MLKNLEKQLKKIKDDKAYSPTEIVNLGLGLNTKLVPSIWVVYRLIKGGKLKPMSVGNGDKFPRYLVEGKELKSYFNKKYGNLVK